MEALSVTALPKGFEEWLPYVTWALPTQSGRRSKKMASTFDELKSLYDFGMTGERLVEALRYLDRFPLDELPADGQRLLEITLSMAEVRPQVEMYGELAPAHMVPPTRLYPTADSDGL